MKRFLVSAEIRLRRRLLAGLRFLADAFATVRRPG